MEHVVHILISRKELICPVKRVILRHNSYIVLRKDALADAFRVSHRYRQPFGMQGKEHPYRHSQTVQGSYPWALHHGRQGGSRITGPAEFPDSLG